MITTLDREPGVAMNQSRPITWITAEIGEGAQEIECKYGPAALRWRLNEHSEAVRWRASTGHVFDQDGPESAGWRRVISNQALLDISKLAVVADFAPRLADTLKEVAQTHFPVVIGGDHSCAIGTWSGMADAWRGQGDIGLIWIDAHLDSHTPATSDTHAPHGMPLAALLGHGDTRLTQLYGWVGKLKAAHVVVIGARSYESDEASLLNRLGVRVMDIDEVRARGMVACMVEAIAIVSRDTVGYGVTFDVDALDPCDAPGVGSPVENGIRLADALEGLKRVANDPQLLGFELVEYNPALDDAALTTAAACYALLAATLGTRVHWLRVLSPDAAATPLTLSA
jgi:arginase